MFVIFSALILLKDFIALIENARNLNDSVKVMHNNYFCCFTTISKFLAIVIMSF